MEKQFSYLISSLENELNQCESTSALLSIKSQYLGKKGKLPLEFQKITKLKSESKKILGQALNKVKTEIIDLIEKKKILLESVDKNNKNKHDVDVTLPGRNIQIGSRHPITLTIDSVNEILSDYGFLLSSGPEIENEFFNFEALNIPKNHPARDLHDTFYIGKSKLLRTHTSSVQIHSMLNNKPPIKIMTPGKVYRCDSDPTHSPMFHQIEGLYIDKNVNFSHLKGLLIDFIHKFFKNDKIEIRFRPSYFPFTEPSAEMDIKFKGKWLEILGCGMVHPNVLDNVKINNNIYSGYAFGLGIERLAMLKFNISDLKVFFDNDLTFLSQFDVLR